MTLLPATALEERFTTHNKLMDLAYKGLADELGAPGFNEFCQYVDEELAKLRVDGKTIEELDDIADKITHEFPQGLWEQLGKGSGLGTLVPGEYGGGGLGHAYEAIVAMKLAEKSGSFALSKVAHSDLFGRQMIVYGNDEQKAKFLPYLADGTKIFGLAMSEDGAGTAVPKQIKTRAEKVEGGWKLNGQKMWITNAVHKDPQTGEDVMADAVIVYAKTFDEKLGKDRITAFIVEKDMIGFEPGQPIDKEGMRGSDTREIVLKDCEVPDANVLGEVHQGSSIMMDGLVDERLHLAAIMLGIARASWKAQTEYLVQRNQNGIIAYNDDVAVELAEMYKDIENLQQKLMDTATKIDLGLIDRKKDFDLATSVFWDSSIVAEKVTSMEKQHFGGYGQTTDQKAGRRHRDQAVLHVGGGAISPARKKLVARRVIPGYHQHVKQKEEMTDLFNDKSLLTPEIMAYLNENHPDLAQKIQANGGAYIQAPGDGTMG